MPYKQSHPDPAQRELIFEMTQANGAPDIGLVFLAGDLQLRKPRAFGAAANSSPWVNVDPFQRAAVVELGNGAYVYTFTPAELDTPGPGFAFKAQKGAGMLWTDTDEITRAYIGTVTASPSLTPATFTTNRAEGVADFWKDALVLFLTGALVGQVKKVGGYTVAGGVITLASGLAFTAAPAAGDVFELIDR